MQGLTNSSRGFACVRIVFSTDLTQTGRWVTSGRGHEGGGTVDLVDSSSLLLIKLRHGEHPWIHLHGEKVSRRPYVLRDATVMGHTGKADSTAERAKRVAWQCTTGIKAQETEVREVGTSVYGRCMSTGHKGTGGWYGNVRQECEHGERRC